MVGHAGEQGNIDFPLAPGADQEVRPAGQSSNSLDPGGARTLKPQAQRAVSGGDVHAVRSKRAFELGRTDEVTHGWVRLPAIFHEEQRQLTVCGIRHQNQARGHDQPRHGGPEAKRGQLLYYDVLMGHRHISQLLFGGNSGFL